jgi:hypothetical protein
MNIPTGFNIKYFPVFCVNKYSQCLTSRTPNTGKYFMLSTVGIFICTTYWEILYVEHWEDLFTQNTGKYQQSST